MVAHLNIYIVHYIYPNIYIRRGDPSSNPGGVELFFLGLWLFLSLSCFPSLFWYLKMHFLWVSYWRIAIVWTRSWTPRVARSLLPNQVTSIQTKHILFASNISLQWHVHWNTKSMFQCLRSSAQIPLHLQFVDSFWLQPQVQLLILGCWWIVGRYRLCCCYPVPKVSTSAKLSTSYLLDLWPLTQA